MKTYKGFDKDLKCRDFQYEIGKEYEVDGDVSVCENGFHACAAPLEVFDYYSPVDSRYCEVEQSWQLDTGHGSKIASKKIKIGAEIGIKGLVDAHIELIREKTEKNFDDAQIGSSGYAAQIGSSGVAAQIGSSGYAAQIGSSGRYAQIGSSGDDAKIGSSGVAAQIGSSGDAAQIGSSGDDAKIGSSGVAAKIGSSGYAAQIGSSGRYAKIGSSGDDAFISCEADHAVVCCAGKRAKVKAPVGTWITLSEYGEWDGDGCPCVCVKSAQIDGETLKADTWYTLKNGEFVEVDV